MKRGNRANLSAPRPQEVQKGRGETLRVLATRSQVFEQYERCPAAKNVFQHSQHTRRVMAPPSAQILEHQLESEVAHRPALPAIGATRVEHGRCTNGATQRSTVLVEIRVRQTVETLCLRLTDLRLRVNRLRLPVRLGVKPAERLPTCCNDGETGPDNASPKGRCRHGPNPTARAAAASRPLANRRRVRTETARTTRTPTRA